MGFNSTRLINALKLQSVHDALKGCPTRHPSVDGSLRVTTQS